MPKDKLPLELLDGGEEMFEILNFNVRCMSILRFTPY